MKVLIVTRACELAIEVAVKETIVEIKQKIQHFLGVPVALQILSVLGWELIDGLDLEDFPIINEGTKIDLTIKSVVQPPTNFDHHNNNNKIQIVVKFSARKINIEIDATETVRSLKEKIHIIESTPIKRMSLYFSGIEMEDYRNVSDYGIRELSEIVVYLKTMSRLAAESPSRGLSVVVQASSSLLNAARIPVEMVDSSTVNELRQLLVARKILPLDDYIFIHKQRIMREHCSLRWHGVENGDSLYVFKGTVSRGGY